MNHFSARSMVLAALLTGAGGFLAGRSLKPAAEQKLEASGNEPMASGMPGTKVSGRSGKPGGAPSGSPASGSGTGKQTEKKESVDLTKLAGFDEQNAAIIEVLERGSPEEMLAFLGKNHAVFPKGLPILQSAWIDRLELLDRSVLEDEVQKMGKGMARHLVFRALSSKITWTSDLGDLKKTAGKLENSDSRFSFLTSYLGAAIQVYPSNVLSGLNQLRDLNPDKTQVLWYNQLVADTVSAVPVDRIPKTWNELGVIDDVATRKITAQRLFSTLYEADSLAATLWLKSLNEGDDKYMAVRYLVQKLREDGDSESAEAWLKSLPERNRMFLESK